jgi:hypothetical protein
VDKTEYRATGRADPVPALTVTGHLRHGYRMLRVASPDVAGAVAAVLLPIRDQTGQLPRVYFTWTEDHPLAQLIRFLVLGVGEVTLRTREIRWRAEPDPARRPRCMSADRRTVEQPGLDGNDAMRTPSAPRARS